jgi:hypothetical protein
MELPWPITTVSIRLIKGPQIQSPVAGPVNFTISFIWFHILCLSSLPDSSPSTTPNTFSETETIPPSFSPSREFHFYLKFGSSHPVKEDPTFVCDNNFQISKNKKNNVTKITQSYITSKFDVIQERKIFDFYFLYIPIQKNNKCTIKYVKLTYDLTN